MSTALPSRPMTAEVMPTIPEVITLRARLGAVAGWLYWPVVAVDAVFGLLCLVVFLAVLVTVPVLQLAAFGYLLELSGRMCRSGSLRAALRDVPAAARWGRTVLAGMLVAAPVWLIDSVAQSKARIDYGQEHGVETFALVAAVLAGWQISAGLARGGRFWQMVLPTSSWWLLRRIYKSSFWTEARDQAWESLGRLQLARRWWLGLQGVGATLAWLAVPATLIAAAGTMLQPNEAVENEQLKALADAVGMGEMLQEAPMGALPNEAAPGAGLVLALGVILMAVVAVHLPFLQANLAAENSVRAGFAWRTVRQRFTRAPLMFAVALLLVLGLAIPLYLLKLEVVPRQAAWMVSVIFVALILPGKLLAGWAMYRGTLREKKTSIFWRMPWRLLLVPMAAFYCLFVYLGQYTAWSGVGSLYEQHAFLLPLPPMGW